jgi:glycine hydroxymethyltransferase
MTTRGMKQDEMKIIAGFIRKVLENPASDSILTEVREAVLDLCSGFPIYQYMEEGD